MLVLSRKIGEEVVMPECGVTIKIVAVTGNRVKLAFTAPPEVAIQRREILDFRRLPRIAATSDVMLERV